MGGGVAFPPPGYLPYEEEAGDALHFLADLPRAAPPLVTSGRDGTGQSPLHLCCLDRRLPGAHRSLIGCVPVCALCKISRACVFALVGGPVARCIATHHQTISSLLASSYAYEQGERQIFQYSSFYDSAFTLDFLNNLCYIIF